MKSKKNVFFTITLTVLVLLVLSAIYYQKVSNQESRRLLPFVDNPEIKQKALEYLNEKLGEAYVEQYITLNGFRYFQYFQGNTETYMIEATYNFPYEGRKDFTLEILADGTISDYFCLEKPHQFNGFYQVHPSS